MSSDLQRIVDSIARRLQLAAAIDDPRLRLQVYSPHYGPVDATRLESILHREAPPAVAEWVRGLGIADTEGAFRLPPNEEFDLMPRVGAPIRCQGVHLGYLWLIDPEDSLDNSQLSELEAAAEAAGTVMYRERLTTALERGREREVTRDLLTGDEAERRSAAVRLAEDRLFQGEGAVVVVATINPQHAAEQPDAHRLVLEQALGSCRRTLEPRRTLALARADHAILVVSTSEAQLRRRGARAVAEMLAEQARRHGDDDALRVVVGVGGPASSLVEVAESYGQAREAMRVAAVVRAFDDLAEWGQLGVYGLLSRLPAHELTQELVPPGLVRLMQEDKDGVLTHTLETYLDLAGDAKGTAERLVIHRTSLYYRLRRIQEISRADLAVGDHRLSLHLGLKVARLAGLMD